MIESIISETPAINSQPQEGAGPKPILVIGSKFVGHAPNCDREIETER